MEMTINDERDRHSPIVRRRLSREYWKPVPRRPNRDPRDRLLLYRLSVPGRLDRGIPNTFGSPRVYSRVAALLLDCCNVHFIRIGKMHRVSFRDTKIEREPRFREPCVLSLISRVFFQRFVAEITSLGEREASGRLDRAEKREPESK